MIEALTVLFLLAGALSLILLDRALSPEEGRFPCASTGLSWALRVYALAIFNRAAVLFVALYIKHTTNVVVLDVFLGSAAMCATHLYILCRMLAARLPHGAWAQVQRRVLAHQRRAAR